MPFFLGRYICHVYDIHKAVINHQMVSKCVFSMHAGSIYIYIYISMIVLKLTVYKPKLVRAHGINATGVSAKIVLDGFNVIFCYGFVDRSCT